MRFRIEATVSECFEDGAEICEEFLPIFYLEAESAILARREARLIIGHSRIITLIAEACPIRHIVPV
jgi:hypothetical protein